MKTSFRSAVIKRVLLLVALTACMPTSGWDTGSCPDGQCSESDSGTLSFEGLSISWEPGSTWEQGRCVDLTVTNGGGSLEYWSLVIRLDQEIETWLSASGGILSAEGDQLTIQPQGDSALAYGDVAEFQYCAEPSANPVEILSGEVKEDEGPPAPLYDSLQDGPLLLRYQSNGESNGGYCLEMTVTNISDRNISNWNVTLYLDGNTRLTDAWGYWVDASGSSSLTLYPGAGAQTLTPYQGREGTVCMTPLVEPVSMVADVTYTDGGGDDTDTTTPGESVTGNFMQDSLYFSYQGTIASNGGDCIEMTITNLSSQSIANWNLSLQMDGTTRWTDYWGFTFLVNGSSIQVFPGQGTGTISAYQSRVGTVCLDPLVEPVSMDATIEYAGTGSTGGGTSSDSTAVAPGSLSDDPLLLSYIQSEPSNGGECLKLSFTNLSLDEIAAWSVFLSMSGPIGITDYWNLYPEVNGASVVIHPGSGMHTMDPYQTREGTLCMNPIEHPIGMDAIVTWAE